MVAGSSKPAGRIGWIDAARALGACAIVVLHVFVSTGLNVELDTHRQVAYAVAGIVGCRWAVPAFFMLTGHLMLDPSRDVTAASALRHAKRMLLAIAVFGTAFAYMEEVWVRVSSGVPIEPSIALVILADVLTMRTWDHLWFVYAMVGVYLAVPLLRLLQERLGDVGFARITMALFVLVLVVPTLLGGFPMAGPISSFLGNTAIGIACCCLGGCLRKWELTPAWIAAGVGSAIIMVMVSIGGIGTGRGDQGFVFLQGSCFASAYAIMLLLVLRRFVGDGALPAESPVNDLARDSFGIYLIHPLFIHVFFIVMSAPPMVPVLYEASLAAAVLTASVVATRALRRIPLLMHVL